MAGELAAPPTWRRRLGAALAGLGIYILVTVTAAVLPSAVGNWAVLIGVVAGTLVAGGLTPALTVRDWVMAAIATLALVVAYWMVVLVLIVSTWSPDLAVP